MEQPENFPAVLNVAFAIIVTLCSFLGLAGYYMYGSGVLDVVTFNMRAGKMKTMCAAMILVNPIAKFAITQVLNCRFVLLACLATKLVPIWFVLMFSFQQGLHEKLSPDGIQEGAAVQRFTCILQLQLRHGSNDPLSPAAYGCLPYVHLFRGIQHPFKCRSLSHWLSVLLHLLAYQSKKPTGSGV